MKHVSRKAPREQASRQLLYIVFGFAVGLAGLTGFVYAVMPGRADLGSAAIGGSFTMIGQDGRVVTNADLAGRPYLVFFGYTHCPDFCPTGSLIFRRCSRSWGRTKRSRRFSSLSIPSATRRRLTGDTKKVEAIAKSF